MAEAIARSYLPSGRFESAGSEVDCPGETLSALRRRGGGHNPYVIGAMENVGIEVGSMTRTQLSPPLLEGFDYVVSMLDEPLAPHYLLESPRYVHWEVRDPAEFDAAETSQTEEEIEINVLEMLATIEACDLSTEN